MSATHAHTAPSLAVMLSAPDSPDANDLVFVVTWTEPTANPDHPQGTMLGSAYTTDLSGVVGQVQNAHYAGEQPYDGCRVHVLRSDASLHEVSLRVHSREVDEGGDWIYYTLTVTATAPFGGYEVCETSFRIDGRA